MLLGCVAIASWLLKHTDTQEFFHPRSVSAMEEYLYDSEQDDDMSAKDKESATEKVIVKEEPNTQESQMDYKPVFRTGSLDKSQSE